MYGNQKGFFEWFGMVLLSMNHKLSSMNLKSKPPATIDDVARTAGVSKGTVSAVLNNKPTVSPDTRARVESVMEQLHYRRLRAPSQKPVNREMPTLAFVIKELNNPFYAEVSSGADHAAMEAGYHLMVVSSHGNAQHERSLCALLPRLGVKGLILSPVLGGEFDLSHLYELKKSGFPFVLLENAGSKQIWTNYVDSDNVQAMKMASLQLIDAGYTHVLHFAGPPYSAHAFERQEGFRHAFSESSRTFREDMIIQTGATSQDGYRSAMRVLPSLNGTVGIVCFNDLVALGVLKALHELQMRVPEEVGVIGFDNLEILRFMPQGLSTVGSNNHEMGRLAVEILIRAIQQPSTKLEQHSLPSQFIQRETTLATALDFATY